jgi:hypothetical protein
MAMEIEGLPYILSFLPFSFLYLNLIMMVILKILEKNRELQDMMVESKAWLWNHINGFPLCSAAFYLCDVV